MHPIDLYEHIANEFVVYFLDFIKIEKYSFVISLEPSSLRGSTSEPARAAEHEDSTEACS